MTRLADTSFLVALFASGDRNFAHASDEAARPEPILVPSDVFGETLSVFQRRRGVDFARLVKAWIDGKPHFQIVFTQREHYEIASRAFAASAQRLNYVDTVLLAWTARTGARLLTYDEDLARAAA